MSLHVYRLAAADPWVVFALFLLVFALAFWIILAVPRSYEAGQRPLFGTRAALVLFSRVGHWPIQAGGNFYRVTVYEDFIAIILIGSESIPRSEIESVHLKLGFVSELGFTVGKVRVRIFGGRNAMSGLNALLKR